MLQTWSVRDALQGAIQRLALLQGDPRLGGAEQALVGELSQVDTLALNALRADGTISPGQRTARAQAIEDKVFALDAVEYAHATLPVDSLYNAKDLSQDAARAIRLGLPTFTSDIGT